MILKSAAASQSALRWSCQPLQCLGRLNEMPRVENKNDCSASPRAAPPALQGLCVPARGEFPALLLPCLEHQSWSPGIIKVGKDQGAFCTPLFLEQWLRGCTIPAWPQQHEWRAG